jgi:two-component system NtrC family response regulator
MDMMVDILIVDDDPKICLFFETLLAQLEHDFKTAKSLREAREQMDSGNFDLVLLDLELPDGNGLDLMPELADSVSAPEVIIITGTGDVRGAELAFKYGAWDYVQKPFLIDEVTLPISRAIQYRKEKLAKPILVPLERSGIIGDSPAIRQCLELVGKAAVTDASVLITGETGTGKELFARAIHNNSHRSSKPFVAVDCGALPDTLVESTLFGHEKGAFTGAGNRQEGLLVQADTGTLMLDEIGDLPMPAQKSLLRTLQERSVRPVGASKEIQVDIRLVAATNLDLDEMISQKRFRQDLLYRIRAFEIKLPSLRERQDDIEEIAVIKLHELSKKYGMTPKSISPELLELLKTYDWPGNIRELINVIENLLASSGTDSTLFPKHLPASYRLSDMAFEQKQAPLENDHSMSRRFANPELPSLADYRQELEKKYLKELMFRVNGDRKAACRMSGVSQSRLYALLAKHSLPGFSN